jgi:hypothetical protein
MGNRTGKDNYIMDLSNKNKLGEGSFGIVYKIMTYD